MTGGRPGAHRRLQSKLFAMRRVIEIHPLSRPVNAEISVPGSKSITNRALVLAALTRGLGRSVPLLLMGSGLVGGAEEMGELLRIGVMCTTDAPQARPNMKEVLAMLIKISNPKGDSSYGPYLI